LKEKSPDMVQQDIPWHSGGSMPPETEKKNKSLFPAVEFSRHGRGFVNYP
jgi:hypothetical protein